MPLAKNTNVACLGSILGTFWRQNLGMKAPCVHMERVFKHIFPMLHFGLVVLSVLVYRHWFLLVLAFTGKLPRAYLKTCVSQGK